MRFRRLFLKLQKKKQKKGMDYRDGWEKIDKDLIARENISQSGSFAP